MNEKDKSRTGLLDPRTKLFVVLFCGTFTFLADEKGLLLLFVMMLVYLSVQGMYKKALKFFPVFVLLFMLQHMITAYLTGAVAVLGFVVFIIVRFMPVFMAVSVLSAVAPGELIAALQKLRLPKAVIIPLAVGLRFMPSISREFLAIRDAMCLRGISPFSINALRHPVMTMECIFVPLLMRSMKISDELAASASARGIDNPGSRTCLRQLYFGIFDGLALAVLLTAGIITGLFFIK
ncbi:MAG TPA: energy-coupling factor transporter transmembrane component T [Lachnospiraceae bacterium]|nr:energy-coupling factor transporter transmembrane component T [Lachnospiraceae bacterium]